MAGQDKVVFEFRNVHRSYPGQPPVVAVDGVSFALARGAFAALVGPSGSGKTTLLNLASGLDRPTQGEIWIAGKNICTLSQKELCAFRRESLGFVFQSYNLFPVLTAIENVEYTCIIRGDDPDTARQRARRALEMVGLDHKIRAFPNQLSGGQQQRLAVARALATNPAVIFADEPTANLDSKTAMKLIELFEELNKKFNVTFLFSTHDTKLVERVQIRFEMEDGRVVHVKDRDLAIDGPSPAAVTHVAAL